MTRQPLVRSVLALPAALLLAAGTSAGAGPAQQEPRPEKPPEPSEPAAAAAPTSPPSAAARPAAAPAVPAVGPAQEPAAPPRPQQSYLGVVLEDVTGEDAERLGLPGQRGALVREVAEGSPADSAGLRAGDVVVEWRGESVYSAAELGRLVRETPAGRRVEVAVYRDGSRTSLSVTLRERHGPGGFFRGPDVRFRGEVPPEVRARIRKRMERAREEWEGARGGMEHLDERLEELDFDLEEAGDSISALRFRLAPRIRGGAPASRMSERARLGAGLQSLTPQLAEYFGLGNRTGALVASVREGSPADSAGLRAGDVLLSVAGEEVSGVGEAVDAVRGASGEVEIRVLRRGEERTLTVRLPEEGDGDGEEDPGRG